MSSKETLCFSQTLSVLIKYIDVSRAAKLLDKHSQKYCVERKLQLEVHPLMVMTAIILGILAALVLVSYGGDLPRQLIYS